MIWLKFTFTLLLSWYPFMCTHEFGHIISAKLNGGQVEEVILVPWRFSQTVISGSTDSLMDVWAGPFIGVLVPCLLCLTLKIIRKSNFYTTTFCGFCLLANGLYLGVGWIDKVGDCKDILANGGNVTSMIIFGLCACASGLLFWHWALEKLRI